MEKRFLYIFSFFIFLSNFLSSAIQITLTADPNIACIGCSISFSVNSPCNLTGATFYWNFGDNTTATTDTPFTSHVYNSPGDYNVSVLVVKSNDSGSASTTVSIKQLGVCTIDGERIYDIEGRPLWFHIHAFQISLTDTNGSPWNPSLSRCMHVLYEWWNCWDGAYPPTHANEYTFPSIFTIGLNDTAVETLVECECGTCVITSNRIHFFLTQRIQ